MQITLGGNHLVNARDVDAQLEVEAARAEPEKGHLGRGILEGARVLFGRCKERSAHQLGITSIGDSDRGMATRTTLSLSVQLTNCPVMNSLFGMTSSLCAKSRMVVALISMRVTRPDSSPTVM